MDKGKWLWQKGYNEGSVAKGICGGGCVKRICGGGCGKRDMWRGTRGLLKVTDELKTNAISAAAKMTQYLCELTANQRYY